MRILWFIDGIAGGGGTMLYHLLSALPKYEHIVITSAAGRESAHVEKMVSQIHSTRLYRSEFHSNNQDLFTHCARQDPDLMVFHWWLHSEIDLLIEGLRDALPTVKRIAVLHSIGRPTANYDCFIAVSEAAKALLLQTPPFCETPIKMIHNGIQPAKGVRQISPRGTFTTGTVGSLAPHKIPTDYITTIASIGVLGHRHLLVGDGGYLSDLSNVIYSQEIQDRFIITGDVAFGSALMNNLYSQMDLYLFYPSYPEPFPTAVLEAMSFGMPVVAMAYGGVCEQIEHGITGYLCSSQSDLINRCQLLAHDAHLRCQLGRAGKIRARIFTRARMAKEYISLFNLIAKSR